MSGVALVEDGQYSDAQSATQDIRTRIRDAQDWRRRNFELTWQSNLAFASGNHWLVADRNTRSLRRIQDVDPRYRGLELYQADVITEYRTTALGELSSDDDRPQLLLQRDDEASEEFQQQLNRAVGYAWDYECNTDRVLEEVDALTLDLGTAAIRCRFDPTQGPVMQDQVPHRDGQPVLDPTEARDYVANQQEQGLSAGLRTIRRGLITLEALSAFNLLVPPGVSNERYFPWEVVVRPTLLSKVIAQYPAARGLKEDNDIASILGMETSYGTLSPGPGSPQADSKMARLRDHVWLYTYYEMPTDQYPQGRTLTFAGKRLALINTEPSLPYQAPDGTYRSGITYFHWWRVTGRFWSRGLVEGMKDGQIALSKTRTQENEIIDRGMPFTMIDGNSRMKKRTGAPMELVELSPTERQPQIVPGIGPGPWMEQRVAAIREDLEHASGIRAAQLGENPTNVTTYAQLALVSENERTKRSHIVRSRQRSIAQIVEDIIYDMRTYWGPQKQITIAGDDDQAQAEIFNATKIPTFFIVRIASGASKPRSQAAQLKLIEDVAQYSVNAQQPVPVSWFLESLNVGEALDLPGEGADIQVTKAELENHLMLQGLDVPVDYFDPPGVHIPIHRIAQVRAQLAGDQMTFEREERHIQAHNQAAMANQQAIAAQAPTALPPGGPTASANGSAPQPAGPGGAAVQVPNGGSPPAQPGLPTPAGPPLGSA
jgi:hypothetical protein